MTDLIYPRALSEHYDESYYTSHSAGKYSWGEAKWHAFFDHVADAIVSEFDPSTVFDAGCGIGFLVGALRSRGVEAWGIDLSEYAIAQVPVELKPYCSVASVTEALTRDYDLITCIEVLEHLPSELAVAAVRNLTRHTDSVLFSSSPGDYREPTHMNVQPIEYWVGLFAEHGFFRNLDLDAAFLAPQAIHFRRTGQTAVQIARAYERWHWRNVSELRELRAARLEDHKSLASARKESERRQSEARSATTALEQLQQTRTFRYTKPLRRVYGRLRAPRDREAPTYGEWIAAFDTLSDDERDVIRVEAKRLRRRPLVSVLMPVFDPPGADLERAIRSVRDQLYDNWELCIADDASTNVDTRRRLQEYAAQDQRIKVVLREVRGGISVASNAALELCAGEYVALLDHDDELPVHALFMVVRELNSHPDTVIIFSDEDKIDEQGNRRNPYFKPDWNPDLLRSQNCISHLGVYRRSDMHEVGGFREGFEGSQDYDLALRIVERIRDDQIRHIPAILYHWRMSPGSAAGSSSSKPYAVEAARAALTDHMRRTGRAAEVVPASNPDFNRVRYALPSDPPLVSIVIATRDGIHLEECITSLRGLSTYPSYEIIVVDNQSTLWATHAYLRSLSDSGAAQVLEYDDFFNHSAIGNLAVQEARGDILCLLNDDVEVLTSDWLEEMVSHAVRPEVGAVGAKLLYPDGRIQHAGVVLGLNEIAGHANRLLDSKRQSYFDRAALVQNYSAVTGACLVVRRSVYEAVGGLDAEHLPHIYNDVDFCLRVRTAGYWNVWTPYAKLVHHESVTRRAVDTEAAAGARLREHVDYMRARWGALLAHDPAYNPNLTLSSENFSYAWPPRTDRPWSRPARRQRPRSGKRIAARKS